MLSNPILHRPIAWLTILGIWVVTHATCHVKLIDFLSLPSNGPGREVQATQKRSLRNIIT